MFSPIKVLMDVFEIEEQKYVVFSNVTKISWREISTGNMQNTFPWIFFVRESQPFTVRL